MNNEQLFESICPYLPYGIKARLSKEGIFNLDSEYPNPYANKAGIVTSWNIYENIEIGGVLKVGDNYSFDFLELSEIEMIFRPLSDLTQPCLEGGLVPIVELLRIYNEKYGDLEKIEFHQLETFTLYGLETDTSYEVSIPLEIYKHLYKWHFWLGDQSEFGNSIIDINTI